jgi:hypothetical protein
MCSQTGELDGYFNLPVLYWRCSHDSGLGEPSRSFPPSLRKLKSSCGGEVVH